MLDMNVQLSDKHGTHEQSEFYVEVDSTFTNHEEQERFAAYIRDFYELKEVCGVGITIDQVIDRAKEHGCAIYIVADGDICQIKLQKNGNAVSQSFTREVMNQLNLDLVDELLRTMIQDLEDYGR